MFCKQFAPLPGLQQRDGVKVNKTSHLTAVTSEMEYGLGFLRGLEVTCV